MMVARLAALFALPLLLASCFYSPGTFTSDMTVEANGAFRFRYTGQIVFLSLYQLMQEKDRDAAADGRCWGALPDVEATDAGAATPELTVDAVKTSPDLTVTHGITGDGPPRTEERAEPVTSAAPTIVMPAPADADGARDCTPGEIAERAESRAQKAARDKEEAARFQQLLGFNPEDEATMHAFAAQAARQKGWKSVVYRGKGIFDVAYEIAGTLDRDFLFPIFADAAVITPMVIVRRRADNNVQITAPSFANTAGNPMAAMALMGTGGGQDIPRPSPADGVFTLTTRAPILTNNTEDGPLSAGGVQTLRWTIDSRTTKMPEALLRLSK